MIKKALTAKIVPRARNCTWLLRLAKSSAVLGIDRLHAKTLQVFERYPLQHGVYTLGGPDFGFELRIDQQTTLSFLVEALREFDAYALLQLALRVLRRLSRNPKRTPVFFNFDSTVPKITQQATAQQTLEDGPVISIRRLKFSVLYLTGHAVVTA
jgi:hypothetical protein|tara:strand:- start:925 stop:1389 length:465 start_codon:yes stop_codon:yes gene_type:complete